MFNGLILAHVLRKDLTMFICSLLSASFGFVNINEGVIWYVEFSLYNGLSMKNAAFEGSLLVWVKFNLKIEFVLLN